MSSDKHAEGALQVEDVVDHEENCAACGVNERVDGTRHCEGCYEALVADGGTPAEAVEHRGGVSSIQVSPGQFEQLRENASAYILQFLDYVDLPDGRSYSVCQNDFTKEVYFVEVDDAV